MRSVLAGAPIQPILAFRVLLGGGATAPPRPQLLMHPACGAVYTCSLDAPRQQPPNTLKSPSYPSATGDSEARREGRECAR
eukprot:scaffold36552_cov163-Isochrysis_galbana.AAC.1